VYLKSLEVQGFKSFPDKTLIRFGDDITAIVGPNGSGKSNISDAILWVMGEQSTKTLRGAKMEDIIFGGTAKRAAVGFAEATLLLDNTDRALAYDSDEVMVTRRYYRSGDSEFYINKQSARLKDIHELFMDTGLGREGYSNIGQGRIDEILSLKAPTAVRFLRKPPVSPSIATARRKPSGSWQRRRIICSVSVIRSLSWNCSWNLCASNRKRRKNT